METQYKQWSQQWIKQSKFNYLQCQMNGLHEGQKLSFVCIEPKCQKKGLICPVCQQIEHKNHKILHLKVFLGKLTDNFLASETEKDSQQPYKQNLSDKLQNIDKCRKQMLKNLQNSVKNIAEEIKKIQNKINENFAQIRRVILSQSTIQRKLPKVFNLLTSVDENGVTLAQQNRQEINKQIKNYVQIADVKNKKIIIGGDSQKIIKHYQEHSDAFVAHLVSLMTDIPDKLSSLPLKIENSYLLDTVQNKDNKDYTFSTLKKANGISISNNKKQIYINQQISTGGIACIDNISHEQETTRKISFKINNCVSDSICVGVYNPDHLTQLGYQIDQLTQLQGFYGICAMGINLSDIENPSMVFSTGDILELQLDIQKSMLTIHRKNSIEKEQLLLGLGKQVTSKLQFFASLVIVGDKLQIVV